MLELISSYGKSEVIQKNVNGERMFCYREAETRDGVYMIGISSEEQMVVSDFLDNLKLHQVIGFVLRVVERQEQILSYKLMISAYSLQDGRYMEFSPDSQKYILLQSIDGFIYTTAKFRNICPFVGNQLCFVNFRLPDKKEIYPYGFDWMCSSYKETCQKANTDTGTFTGEEAYKQLEKEYLPIETDAVPVMDNNTKYYVPWLTMMHDTVAILRLERDSNSNGIKLSDKDTLRFEVPYGISVIADRPDYVVSTLPLCIKTKAVDMGIRIKIICQGKMLSDSMIKVFDNNNMLVGALNVRRNDHVKNINIEFIYVSFMGKFEIENICKIDFDGEDKRMGNYNYESWIHRIKDEKFIKINLALSNSVLMNLQLSNVYKNNSIFSPQKNKYNAFDRHITIRFSDKSASFIEQDIEGKVIGGGAIEKVVVDNFYKSIIRCDECNGKPRMIADTEELARILMHSDTREQIDLYTVRVYLLPMVFWNKLNEFEDGFYIGLKDWHKEGVVMCGDPDNLLALHSFCHEIGHQQSLEHTFSETDESDVNKKYIFVKTLTDNVMDYINTNNNTYRPIFWKWQCDQIQEFDN